MKITNKNIWSIIVSIVCFVAIMALNFFVIDKIEIDSWRIFGLTLSSTIATVILANVLWEVIAKENFAKSILEQVRISENIAQSGIDSVYVDFRDIDWGKEFRNTKTFTAVFIYAYSWRSNNDAHIKKFASKSSRRKKMTIIVPDPENIEIMSDLDRRFNFERGATKKKVEDCIKYFFDLGATVYLYGGTLQASYYKMDNECIMSFFTHTKEKGTVPALKAAKDGNMYKYISKDIDALIGQSDQVTCIQIDIINGTRTVLIGRKKQ